MTRGSAAISVVALVVLWQMASLAIGSPALPSPLDVLIVFVLELSGDLGKHLFVSACRVLAAIILSTTFGVPIGVVVGRDHRLSRLLNPSIYLIYPIPKIVFLPIVLVLLGLGERSKVLMIALVLFFQILVVVRDAAGNIPLGIVSSVQSLGAGQWHMIRYVYIPACLPAILTALRVGTGTAIAVLFFAESFATRSGLGYYIMVETWGRMDYVQMYAGVLAMSLLGLSLYVLLEKLDRRLCPWAHLVP